MLVTTAPDAINAWQHNTSWTLRRSTSVTVKPSALLKTRSPRASSAVSRNRILLVGYLQDIYQDQRKGEWNRSASPFDKDFQ
jgi:hypothetical protein